MQLRMNSFLVALIAVAVLVGMAGAAQAGLIAHWTFDETGGTTAYDSTGNHNGTIDTTVYPVQVNKPGKIGKSYLFPGTLNASGNGGVVVPSGVGNELETFVNITLCGWVYGDFEGEGQDWTKVQHHPIICKSWPNSSGPPLGNSYFLAGGLDDYWMGEYGGPAIGSVLSVKSHSTYDHLGEYDNAQWYHIVSTYTGPVWDGATTGPATAKVYINGTLMNTLSSTTHKGILPNQKDLYLGTMGKPSSTYAAMDGYLDDLGVWNELLSDAKVAALFNVVEDLGLAYNLSDMEKLFNVYDTGTSDTIKGLVWEKETNLPGGHSDGDAWAAGGYLYVQLETGSAMGVKAEGVIPEPSTLLLLATGLLGLLAYAWQKRQ